MIHLLLSWVLTLAVSINAQPPSTLEEIRFNSANPYTFNDIMVALEDQEPQEVYGVLRFPEGVKANEQLPLVIGVAGSLGWREHHLEYLEMYREQGIATFELKSFSSRGITSTVGSQSEVTMAAMVLDAYRALEALSNHPRIDPSKIAISGWSLGGGVTLFSGWLPLKEAITKEVSFALKYPFEREDRVRRHRHLQPPKRDSITTHHHAGLTKLAMTRLMPAFSNSMSNLSPSTYATRP